jgi:hypothetical protein
MNGSVTNKYSKMNGIDKRKTMKKKEENFNTKKENKSLSKKFNEKSKLKSNQTDNKGVKKKTCK